MRRILVTLLFALAACGDGGTQPSSVVGSYTLRSIDGASLPVSIGSRGRVVGAMLTLTADGEFLMTMGTELNGVTETTMLWAGTYTRTAPGSL